MIIEVLAAKGLREFFGVAQRESMKGSIWHGVGRTSAQNDSLVYGDYEHLNISNYDWMYYDTRDSS